VYCGAAETEYTLKYDAQDGFAFLTGLAEQLIKLEGRDE